ncbi:MFS transporter [Brevibacillus sp. B_LB10_24]|uniref:MFS transporter n=1 Tax=Brevibacillus sp. B_LB10_24 TaxID=3380645 RepID=UPI0038BDFF18
MSITILFLMSTMFIANIGYGVILPTLPFLSRHIGATSFEMGLALSVFAIAQLLSSSLWGVLSDRLGRRPVLICGIVGYGVSSALLGFAPHVAVLLTLRFLSGLFASAVMPASLALAADWTKPGQRARTLGYMGAINGIGFIFGPPVGAFLSVIGLQVPFFTVGLLSVANGLIALRLLPREEPLRQDPVGSNTKAALLPRPSRRAGALGSRMTAPFLFGTFVFALADASITATLAYYLTGHLHSTQTMAGWGFMVNGGMGALTQGLLFSRVYGRYGETATIVLGFAFGSLGYFTLGMANWLAWAFAAIALLALCRGFAYPAMTTAISVRTSQNAQGSSFGAQFTFNSLGRTIGPLIAGWLFTLKEPVPYFFSAALMFLTIGVYLAWVYAARRHDRPLQGNK